MGLYPKRKSKLSYFQVSVRQFADICLFSTAQYKCCVDEKVIIYLSIYLLYYLSI